jgi:lipopolysaccharide export system protein LptC
MSISSPIADGAPARRSGPPADVARRRALYAGLERRNRRVAMLRILVPGLGALVLAVLVAFIVIANSGLRFTIGQLEITPDTFSIAAPVYSGILEDGTTYRVTAQSAVTRLDTLDRMGLNTALVEMQDTDGVETVITAAQAELEMPNERIHVSGIAELSDSAGLSASFRDSVVDWAAQTLVSRGGVVIDYADGTHLEADGMSYDIRTQRYEFTRVNVTMPDLPDAADADEEISTDAAP